MTLLLRKRLFWIGLPLLIGLITPNAVVWYLDVFVGQKAPGTAFLDVIQKQDDDGLLILAIFGLIPFALLAIASFVIGMFVSGRRLACISIAGLIGILALMIPFHYAVQYPLYAHEHVSSTQSLAFIVIPFLCLITLVIGGLVGWALSFIPFLRTHPPPLPTPAPL